MPRFSYADVHLEVDPEEASLADVVAEPDPIDPPDEDTPFRILVMGDFSGRDSRLIQEGSRLGLRRPLLVDRDNVEAILAKMGVEIWLKQKDPQAAPVEISFDEMDDFHPDRLYGRIPIFAKLREMREQLEDPATFRQAARELEAATRAPAPPEPITPTIYTGDSLLEQALEMTERQQAETADPMTAYLRSIVSPHLVPKPNPKQSELLVQLDEAIAGAMRQVLHHPAFQSVESAWRSLVWLLRGLETSGTLKVYLLDVTQAELAEDLLESSDLRQTGLHRLLVQETVGTPGAHPWATIIGNYSFGPGIEDLSLLGRIGLLAAKAGSAFIAAGKSSLLGCESIDAAPEPENWGGLNGSAAEGWQFLRRFPEARYAGLVMPRFLLRLPYGREFEQPEHFDFEEFGPGWNHRDYLWGNGAFVAAYLLGEGFAQYGWAVRPGLCLDVHDLPLHVYQHDGEALVKPTCEVLLTEEAAEHMLGQGLMPLLSYKDRDLAHLAGFRSIADPAANLAGPWGR